LNKSNQYIRSPVSTGREGKKKKWAKPIRRYQFWIDCVFARSKEEGGRGEEFSLDPRKTSPRASSKRLKKGDKGKKKKKKKKKKRPLAPHHFPCSSGSKKEKGGNRHIPAKPARQIKACKNRQFTCRGKGEGGVRPKHKQKFSLSQKKRGRRSVLFNYQYARVERACAASARKEGGP